MCTPDEQHWLWRRVCIAKSASTLCAAASGTACEVAFAIETSAVVLCDASSGTACEAALAIENSADTLCDAASGTACEAAFAIKNSEVAFCDTAAGNACDATFASKHSEVALCDAALCGLWLELLALTIAGSTKIEPPPIDPVKRGMGLFGFRPAFDWFCPLLCTGFEPISPIQILHSVWDT